MPVREEFLRPGRPLLHFDAASASYFFCAARIPASHADHDPLSTGTSHRASIALQHFRTGESLFSPSEEGVFQVLPYLEEASLSGFGYPLSDFHSPPLGGLFQLPTLLGYALQSFSPVRRSTSDFSLLFPSSRFPVKPFGLTPAPRRLSPTEPAVPLIANSSV